LPDSPERQRQELEFCSALGAVARAAKGDAARETGDAYTRAGELWEQLGSPSEFLHVPHGQSRYLANRGKLDSAQRLAEDLLRLSRQRDEPAGLVLGHYSCGRNLMLAGRFASSRVHLEKVLALDDPVSHGSLIQQSGDDPRVGSQSWMSIVLFCIGYPDQAAARSSAAIAEARRVAHLPSLAHSLIFGARLHSLDGDNAAFGERLAQLVALTTDQGFRVWPAMGEILNGWNKVATGDVADGISLLRSGSTYYRTAAAGVVWVPYHLALLAKAYESAGKAEEAVASLNEALQIVDRTGLRWLEAELNRHKGQLLLRQGHTEVAEELYHKALSVAGEQGANLWELRAAGSLARLWCDQRREAEAHDLLAPVYLWFTEGFNTPDLKQAKALLDELA
jgi:predicted ATPase